MESRSDTAVPHGNSTSSGVDLLGRRDFVENLARILSVPCPNETSVFALYGEWGSGKTFVKDLLVRELLVRGNEAPLSIEFNPWAFSAQDQVMEAFFNEVSKAIGEGPSGREAGEAFKKLGAYWSFAGTATKLVQIGMTAWGIPGAGLLGHVSEAVRAEQNDVNSFAKDIDALGKCTLEAVQKQLVEELRKYKRRLLIILDDLDRVPPDQLIQIFQIVKVNASLPSVNFLLLMDRKTVEMRLADRKLGPEFLEKVIHFELNLPRLDQADLKRFLTDGFRDVVKPVFKEVDWKRWENISAHCLKLLKTLRRVNRIIATFRFHVEVFTRDRILELDPIDLFVIEVLRVLTPALYSEAPKILRSIVDEGMPSRSWQYDSRLNQRLQRKSSDRTLLRVQQTGYDPELLNQRRNFGAVELNAALAIVPNEIKTEVDELLKLLFPQICNEYIIEHLRGEWFREARICHEIFFESYFKLALPQGAILKSDLNRLLRALVDLESDQVEKILETMCQKVGRENLGLQIANHRLTIDHVSLQLLLGALWQLDERDAKKDPMNRRWEPRNCILEASLLLLDQIRVPSRWFETAFKASLNSGGVYHLARIVDAQLSCMVDRDYNDDGESSPWEESKEALRLKTAQILRAAADDGTLLKSPFAGELLTLWAALESREDVKVWLKKEITTDVTFILSLFVSKFGYSQNFPIEQHGKSSYFGFRRLTDLVSLDDEFESILKGVELSKIAEIEQFAIKAVRWYLDRKREGSFTLEYGGANLACE